MKLFQQYAPGVLDQVGNPIAQQLYPKRPDWAVASISEQDAAFFSGLVQSIKPQKVLEIGVASGWGSVVLLESCREFSNENFEYVGIDIASRFFYDADFATGQAVEEISPDLLPIYRLITEKSAGQAMLDVDDGIDFAFIDAHHMHPWATLDMLSILPFMKKDSWIALHDLNLSRKEDQAHKNRGPKYLYEGWVGDRLHSTESPAMAGAIKIEGDSEQYLDVLLDILYTPWELPVEQQHILPIIDIIKRSFGSEWADKFSRAAEIGNYLAHKIHSQDIDTLSSEVSRLRNALENKGRDILNGILRQKDS